MEQWEVDLRARLQKDLPDGAYFHETKGMKLWTGKGGEIELIVAFHKEVKKVGENLTEFQEEFKLKEKYKYLTENELAELISETLYKIRDDN